MKIYDCFQFYDEEMLLDLRLNIMDKFVDKFIITEATYSHNGKPKKLIFDIKNFSRFKDKIIYVVVDEQPKDLFEIEDKDNNKEDTKGQKLILNGYKRDNYQRQMAKKILDKVDPDDWILINDIDEIPNLENLDIKKIKNKLIIFKQKIFYYKFNLLYENVPWFGSRMCQNKNLISPQWLRDLKHKKYPFWRLDTLFSNSKHINIDIINNGGWHFSHLMSPEELYKKLINFGHHSEFEQSGLKLEDIKNKVKEKKVFYNHFADKENLDKWNFEYDLKIISDKLLPAYLSKNKEKYREWFE